MVVVLSSGAVAADRSMFSVPLLVTLGVAPRVLAEVTFLEAPLSMTMASSWPKEMITWPPSVRVMSHAMPLYSLSVMWLVSACRAALVTWKA